MKYRAVTGLILLSVIPAVTHAQAFGTFLQTILDLLNLLLPILIALNFVLLVWGAVQYIRHGGDTTKRDEGRKVMLFGIIGLFVMVSIWGLVAILLGTFFGRNTPQLLTTDVPYFSP